MQDNCPLCKLTMIVELTPNEIKATGKTLKCHRCTSWLWVDAIKQKFFHLMILLGKEGNLEALEASEKDAMI